MTQASVTNTRVDHNTLHATATSSPSNQALVGLERGSDCFQDAVFPADDGLTLLPYNSDECLTYEGEINKMAVNIAFGR